MTPGRSRADLIYEIESRRVRLLSWFAQLVAVGAVIGCSILTPSYRATVDAGKLDALRPVVEQLAVRTYWHQPVVGRGCTYVDYARGRFSTDIANDACRTYEPSNTLHVDQADAQALLDIAKVDGELTHLALNGDVYLIVYYDSAGTMAAGSVFSFDGCVGYFYSPGGPISPHDDPNGTHYFPVNGDWYGADQCGGD